MDDMQAIEQRLAGELWRRAGPSEPVDDAAIFDAITATQSPTWRFGPMFSATKLVVAGALVALFGGFLLAGLLTQRDDAEAPLVGTTPSASVLSSELPTSLDDSNQAEPLPAVEQVTEQVAPTVRRVVDDGAGHDLSRIWQVVVDQDDNAWVLTQRPNHRNPRIFRLGEPGAYTPADGIPTSIEAIEVGADGRLYAHGDDWAVLTDQGWLPATSEDRAAATGPLDESVGSRITAADGTTWRIGAGDIFHAGPDGRAAYRLEDMGFAWGKRWLKTTGLGKIRPRTLATAPDGRVWSLWLHGSSNRVDPGLALAEFDGEAWRDITPQEWRYRSRWPFEEDDRPGGITRANMSVEADGTLRVTVDVHDFDVHWPGDGSAPVERVVARWDGSDWVIESRTSWDLASIPEPSGRMAAFWIADVAPSGTMVLQIGLEGLDTLLYVIEPELDDSFDQDELLAP